MKGASLDFRDVFLIIKLYGVEIMIGLIQKS